MSNSLSGIGLSGINAAQYGLTTTGQNISNANTPGYNRESVLLKSGGSLYSGGGYLGTGVAVETVKRNYDASLTARLNTAQSAGAALDTYQTEAKLLNTIVGDPAAGINKNMNEFFGAAQALSTNPSDTAARSAMIGSATTLSDAINTTAGAMDEARNSVNGQIESAVTQINKSAQSIAHLNKEIAEQSATGQTPNTLMDQRDKELSTLGNLVNVHMTKQSDGSYTVMTGTGQPLVVGSKTFEIAAVKSPLDPSELTIAYHGVTGGDEEGGEHGYLSESSLTGGSLGGLLQFRSQMLDPAQSNLGRIAATFAGAINDQNQKGLDLNGEMGRPLFTLGQPTVTPNSNNRGSATLEANFSDAKALTGNNYALSYDGNAYTLKNAQTGTVMQVSKFPISVDGVELKLSGSMHPGDSFSIAPTRGVGKALALTTLDGGAIAAATPVVAASNVNNKGTGSITVADSAKPDAVPGGRPGRPEVVPATLTFTSQADPKTGAIVDGLKGFPPNQDVTVTTGTGERAVSKTFKAPADSVPFIDGATVSFGGTAVVMSGSPKQGDTFSIGRNNSLSGDGSNAVKLGNLQNEKLVNGDTLTQGYADYVDNVGTLASQTASAQVTQNTLITQLKTQQQSIQGVNLDEEAANLMQYQQMYQANSKVIQTAGTLFDTILDLVK